MRRLASKTIPQYAVRSNITDDLPYLPGTVKIGPFDFIVQEWAPNKASLRNSMGETDLAELVIRIRSDLPIQRKAETLMHEVMHGIWSVYAIDNVIPGEEKYGECALARRLPSDARQSRLDGVSRIRVQALSPSLTRKIATGAVRFAGRPF
jgi:hypothetical protein